MRSPRTLRLLLAAPLLLLAGCFPIELDVNSKGEMLIYRQEGFFLFHPPTGKVTRLTGPGGGVPVFARFSPNGKEALCVVKDGRHIEEFRFDIVNLDGGKTRTLCRAGNAAYALFSPDGSQLAIVHGSSKKQPQLKERKDQFATDSTDLDIVDVASGQKRTLASHVAVAFRWFRDGKRLLVFQFVDVTRDRYLGKLGEMDVSTGAFRPLVAAISSSTMMIDVSPDEQTILFTAHVTGKPGEMLDPDKELPDLRLCECSTKGGAVRERTMFSEETVFARYSPSGKKILLASPAKGKGILSKKIDIGVTDSEWKKLTPLEDNATEGQRGATGGLAIPGWIDDDTVYYFVERTTYGTSGKSFSLVTAKADGSKKQLVQPALDRSAFEALKAFPQDEVVDQDPLGFLDSKPGRGLFESREEKGGGISTLVLALGIGAVTAVVVIVLVLALRRPAPAKARPKRPSRRPRDEDEDEE